jgi:hypothetical protein
VGCNPRRAPTRSLCPCLRALGGPAVRRLAGDCCRSDLDRHHRARAAVSWTSRISGVVAVVWIAVAVVLASRDLVGYRGSPAADGHGLEPGRTCSSDSPGPRGSRSTSAPAMNRSSPVSFASPSSCRRTSRTRSPGTSSAHARLARSVRACLVADGAFCALDPARRCGCSSASCGREREAAADHAAVSADPATYEVASAPLRRVAGGGRARERSTGRRRSRDLLRQSFRAGGSRRSSARSAHDVRSAPSRGRAPPWRSLSPRSTFLPAATHSRASPESEVEQLPLVPPLAPARPREWW